MLRVTTAHSEYLIDPERKVFSRRRVHEDANHLAGLHEGTEYPYESVALRHGEPMFIARMGGRYVRSTPVLNIEQIEDEA